MTLIWPSLIILRSATSKLVRTMLHFKNTSSDRSLSDILALFGRSTMLHGWKPFPLVHLKPEWQMYSAQLVSVCHMWCYCEPRSQPALSHSHHPLHVSIWLKARHWNISRSITVVFSGVHVVCEQLLPLWPQRSSLLQCYRSCRYKGLEKRTCWQSLQVQVQVRVLRAQVQVQQKRT